MKKIIKKIAICFSMLIMLVSTSMEASAITMRGWVSCGVWVNDRHTNGWGKIANLAFVTGFISGAASVLQIDLLKGVDNNSITLWVDNYCLANPLSNTGEASDTLGEELIKLHKNEFKSK